LGPNEAAINSETKTDLLSQRLAAFAPASDREYHAVQWDRAIKRRFGRLKPKTLELLLDLCRNDDLQSSIVYLKEEYAKNGISTGLKPLEPTLESLNSFANALGSLSQAGPQPAMLLWGSTLLLIQVSKAAAVVLPG
jgi:hypothetical protein